MAPDSTSTPQVIAFFDVPSVYFSGTVVSFHPISSWTEAFHLSPPVAG